MESHNLIFGSDRHSPINKKLNSIKRGMDFLLKIFNNQRKFDKEKLVVKNIIHFLQEGKIQDSNIDKINFLKYDEKSYVLWICLEIIKKISEEDLNRGRSPLSKLNLIYKLIVLLEDPVINID